MDIQVIHDVNEKVHQDGCCGLVHLDPVFCDLEQHQEIGKYKPKSPWGKSFLAKFDSSDFFTWVKPVAGGVWETTNPVFLVSRSY